MSDKKTNTEPLYLLSLEIQGINCFKDKQKLDLSDGKNNYVPWTIILGDNGTGKTSLLRILDRMQPSPIFKNEDYMPLLWAQRNLLTSKYVNITLLVCGDEKYFEYDQSDNYAGSITVSGNIDFSFLLSYGASRRMSKNENLAPNEEGNLKITSLFDETIELINAEEWLLQKEVIAEKAQQSVKKKFQNQFQLVKSILIDILPDVEDIRVKPINENNSKLLLEVNTPYGWVNLRDLSFGYQTLTALIVDIAAKMMEQYSDSVNPLAEPVIILIDEIDLHLHPKWQRTVLDKLSEHFPAAQFIATSHSPLIVQAAQDRGANIVVCRKEGDRVIIDNNPDEVKGWRVDQILVSDLFEIEGSHSREVQNFINEKRDILSKSKLSATDKERLQFINNFMENVPAASDKKAINAEDVIKRAAELLKK